MEQQDDIAYYKRVLNKIIYRYKNQHRQSLHFQYLRRLNSKLRQLPDPCENNPWSQEQVQQIKALILNSFICTKQLMHQGFFLHFCTPVIALLASLWKLVNRHGQLVIASDDHNITPVQEPAENDDDNKQQDLLANQLMMIDVPMIPSFAKKHK